MISNEYRALTAMPKLDNSVFQLGDFRVDPALDEIRKDGVSVKLEPRTMRLLVCLVERAGQVVSVDELLDLVWKDVVVSPDSVYRAVASLRRALGDDAKESRYIANVMRRGYRVVAPVSECADTPAKTLSIDSAQSLSAVAAPLPLALESAAKRRRLWRLAATGLVVTMLALALGYVAVRQLRRSERNAIAAGPPVPSLPIVSNTSVAVLPFIDLSENRDQEYFADGMTDALTTDLAQIGSLKVISRTSAMHFKGSKETLRQIGRDLQVDAVVEGTVSRGERRVRITAQLIEASSDQHLWARTYERDLKEVLALQDEIARDITEQIRVKLTPQERSLLNQVHAVDSEAYEAYMRGRYWWSKRGADVWKGLDYFQKAIAKDPSYALAYVGVADSFFILGSNGNLSPKEALPKGKEAAIKALELDPSLAEAHASLAVFEFFHDRDWPEAENEFKQALALNVNDATAYQSYSIYLTAMGRFDEALKEIERARELDPFSSPVNWWLGRSLYYARRYDDALRQFQRSAEMFPEQFEFYNNIADVYEHKRMFAESFAARQQALSMQQDPTVTALAEAYRHSGYRGWLLKRIEILEQAPPQTVQMRRRESRLDMFKHFGIAYFYTLLNDEAHAMPYLERADVGGNPWVLFLRVSPNWDSIRSSPRFRDLVRRIGAPAVVEPQDKN